MYKMKASFPTPSAVSGSFSNFFYTLPKDFYLVHHLYICSDRHNTAEYAEKGYLLAFIAHIYMNSLN